MSNQQVIGNTVKVLFVAFNKTAECKVDTGATTSSLHATNIKVDHNRGAVSFHSEGLSGNVITLPLHSTQEVHSADAGGNERPVVALDVEVEGNTMIKGALFNLNDRSKMDSKILIGQNILQKADVVIDPKQGATEAPTMLPPHEGGAPRNEAAVIQALEVLIENNVSLAELVTYLRTVAVMRIEG